jgi:hypothetical protein
VQGKLRAISTEVILRSTLWVTSLCGLPVLAQNEPGTAPPELLKPAEAMVLALNQKELDKAFPIMTDEGVDQYVGKMLLQLAAIGQVPNASCSQGCKIHWPMRIASVATIAAGTTFLGALQVAPGITNYVPAALFEMAGLDSGAHQCPSTDSRATAPPVVPQNLPVESFNGTTACAQCEHGIAPIYEARTLGLALVLEDGRIAVVENAHNYYPEIYRRREGHLTAELTGRVVKSEANVIWVQPESLELITLGGENRVSEAKEVQSGLDQDATIQ